MDSPLFAHFTILAQGFAAGLVFGFLLQRGKVSRFNTIVGQFLLKDFTVLKIMLSAIVVGGIGVYGLLSFGLIHALPLRASSVMGSTLGGVIFGIGMATLGYCPGTAIAALAEGARDVLFGFVGMLLGTTLYERAYPFFHETLLRKDQTKETLADIFHVSPWIVLAFLTLGALCLFYLLESFERKNSL